MVKCIYICEHFVTKHICSMCPCNHVCTSIYVKMCIHLYILLCSYVLRILWEWSGTKIAPHTILSICAQTRMQEVRGQVIDPLNYLALPSLGTGRESSPLEYGFCHLGKEKATSTAEKDRALTASPFSSAGDSNTWMDRE